MTTIIERAEQIAYGVSGDVACEDKSWPAIRQAIVRRAMEAVATDRLEVSNGVRDDMAEELDRLRRVEQDHINVLKAALYRENGGIDLVHRLTAYALEQRPQ